MPALIEAGRRVRRCVAKRPARREDAQAGHKGSEHGGRDRERHQVRDRVPAPENRPPGRSREASSMKVASAPPATASSRSERRPPSAHTLAWDDERKRHSGTTHGTWCIGTTSRSASSPSVGAQARSLSQRCRGGSARPQPRAVPPRTRRSTAAAAPLRWSESCGCTLGQWLMPRPFARTLRTS